MADYTPPFTITNTMLDCVASISEKIGKMSALKNLEAKPHLRKNNRIRSIYSSLRIEANSLSIGQVRDVISGQLVLGEQKEIQEVIEKKASEFDGIFISSVELLDSKIPDVELYNLAKANYASYLELLNSKMAQKAESQAEFFVEQDRTLAQLEKLGSMLQKFPQLEEMFKTGDAAQIINAVKSMR